MSKDSLGDRIKKYEDVFRQSLVSRMPIMVRVDGRAFHSYTRGMKKPFDENIVFSMANAARMVAEDMQGFKLAYVQSDEATFLLTDFDDVDTQGWFDYNVNKIVSISASVMTVSFNDIMAERGFTKKRANFDSRAFNVPISDVANAFLWRTKDWKRNSLTMYASSFFSHKQLHRKKADDMHEMLHGIGKNWAKDLDKQLKNGTFLVRTETGIVEKTDVLPTFESVNALVEPLLCVDR